MLRLAESTHMRARVALPAPREARDALLILFYASRFSSLLALAPTFARPSNPVASNRKGQKGGGGASSFGIYSISN